MTYIRKWLEICGDFSFQKDRAFRSQNLAHRALLKAALRQEEKKAGMERPGAQRQRPRIDRACGVKITI